MKGRKQGPGGCAPSHGVLGPCRFAALASLPQPRCATHPGPSPCSHLALPSYHTLSSQSCCSLPRGFFSFPCESSSQVEPVISRPYHSRPSLCIQLDSPACPFERLVKNHDVRRRRLSYIPSLLCSCHIAPIALSTRHATLSRRSHLVSRSLVTLLHPKSLHCRT